jgi:adenosylhomocysteinase
VERGVSVYAWHAATPEEYERHLELTLAFGPDLLIDDGGDLVQLLHGPRRDLAARVRGGNEETTTGIHRLRAREKAGQLLFPMMAVNDAQCKHLFDNRYGTGQSTWDGIVRTTNLLIAGKEHQSAAVVGDQPVVLDIGLSHLRRDVAGDEDPVLSCHDYHWCRKD